MNLSCPLQHSVSLLLFISVLFSITCYDRPPECQNLSSVGNSYTHPLQTDPHLACSHPAYLTSLILQQPEQLSQRTSTLRWKSRQSYNDIPHMEVLPKQIIQKLLVQGCKTTKSTAAAAAAAKSSSSTRHADDPYIKRRHVHDRQK